MIKKFGIGLSFAFALSACNLYGGLSKPGNDEQYLSAARACLDHGDYTCAKENYQALSSAYGDVKISETGLTTLAQDNIFSISDLVASLGTSLGSAASLSTLAETLASRGITSGAYRTSLKSVYDKDASIVEPHLRAFSQFIAALGMFNEVLANAVGPDGKIRASNIVVAANVDACRIASAPGCTPCTAPLSTQFTWDTADTMNMNTAASDWSTPATIQKLIRSALAASNALAAFAPSSSNQGLLKTLNDASSTINVTGLDALGIHPERCARQQIIQLLNL